MRSERVELRVIRTMLGLPAARVETALWREEERIEVPDKSAGTYCEVYRRELRTRHAGEGARATWARSSTIMETRVTAYLALSANPEPGPRPAGVRRGGPPAFLPAQKMARRSEADHSGHRWHGPATAEKVHGRGQDAEFFGAGGKGVVPPAHHQHSAAESGRMVKPDHRHERRAGMAFLISFIAIPRHCSLIFRLRAWNRRSTASISATG